MSKKQHKKINHWEKVAIFRNYLYVTIGCFLLAVGDAVFLTPCNIVSGGVSSIGIIVNYFLKPLWNFDVNTLVVAILELALFVVGYIVVGKHFAMRTLYATLIYPAFYALLYNCHVGELVGLSDLYSKALAGDSGYLILSAIFGGAIVGCGVAFGYLGYGSTGGLDVLSEIIAKYTEMKQDVSGFIFDATIIIVGICVFRNSISGLVGILAAFCCALAVQFVYVYLSSFIIVDIISDHVDEIQDYIHKEMDHATTLIDTVGGYTGEKRKLIRVVIYHNETSVLRSFIATVDPKAFVSFTEAQTINGEGFEPLMIHAKKNHNFANLKRPLDEDRNLGKDVPSLDPEEVAKKDDFIKENKEDKK